MIPEEIYCDSCKIEISAYDYSSECGIRNTSITTDSTFIIHERYPCLFTSSINNELKISMLNNIIADSIILEQVINDADLDQPDFIFNEISLEF